MCKKIYLILFLLFFINKNNAMDFLQNTQTNPTNNSGIVDMGNPKTGAPNSLEGLNIEELLKDVDWNEVAKELETIFGTEDPNDLNPAKQAATIKEKEPQITETEKKELFPTKEKITKKLTPDELFLQPEEIKKEEPTSKAKPKSKKLNPEKIKVFFDYWEKYIKSITQIETQIGSFEFGMATKEELENLKPTSDKKTFSYKSIIDQNEILYKQIESRTFYLKIFFLPIFNKERENILNTFKKVISIKDSLEQLKQEDLPAKSKKEAVKKLKNLIEKDLFIVTTNLEKILSSAQSKQVIETKKQDLAKKALAADSLKRQNNKQSFFGTAPKDFGSKGGFYGYDGYAKPDRQAKSSDYYGSGSYYNPITTTEPTQTTKASDTEKPSSDKDENKTSKFRDNKEGKKEAKLKKSIEKLTNETKKLIQDVLNNYIKDDFKRYEKILQSSKLSEINDNLTKINVKKEKLDTVDENEDDAENKKQPSKQVSKTVKQQKTESDQELNNLINRLIPVCVRLAKYAATKTEFEKERSVAIEICNIKATDASSEKKDKEIEAIQKELIAQLNKELEKFKEKDKNLTQVRSGVSKTLEDRSLKEIVASRSEILSLAQMLFAEPKKVTDNLNEIKKKLLDLFNTEGTRSFEQEGIDEITKEKIKTLKTLLGMKEKTEEELKAKAEAETSAKLRAELENAKAEAGEARKKAEELAKRSAVIPAGEPAAPAVPELVGAAAIPTEFAD